MSSWSIAVCSILPVSAGTERNQDRILLASSTYPAEIIAGSLSWLHSVPAQTGKIEQTATITTMLNIGLCGVTHAEFQARACNTLAFRAVARSATH